MCFFLSTLYQIRRIDLPVLLFGLSHNVTRRRRPQQRRGELYGDDDDYDVDSLIYLSLPLPTRLVLNEKFILSGSEIYSLEERANVAHRFQIRR